MRRHQPTGQPPDGLGGQPEQKPAAEVNYRPRLPDPCDLNKGQDPRLAGSNNRCVWRAATIACSATSSRNCRRNCTSSRSATRSRTSNAAASG